MIEKVEAFKVNGKLFSSEADAKKHQKEEILLRIFHDINMPWYKVVEKLSAGNIELTKLMEALKEVEVIEQGAV